MSQAINRRSSAGTELTVGYRIEVTGPAKSEVALRGLLLEAVRHQRLRPEGLSSEDLEDSDHVNIVLIALGNGQDDAKLERIAAVLGRDPAVRAFSWRVAKLDEESASAGESAE